MKKHKQMFDKLMGRIDYRIGGQFYSRVDKQLDKQLRIQLYGQWQDKPWGQLGGQLGGKLCEGLREKRYYDEKT